MAITDQQFTDWLNSNLAIPCTLVQVGVRSGGVEITRYLSTKPYATSTEYYDDIITASGLRYTERLSLTGSAGLSVGDLEILNPNGERDSWLSDVWENRRIVAYVGDITWPFTDFRVMFDGIVSNIDSGGLGILNLQIADKMQRLNTPLTDLKLLGTTANKDSLIPLVFGEVHNISPLLSDPNVEGGEYYVSIGPVERIIEARANGVPVSITKLESTGKFRLTYPLKGTLTCDVQGYTSGTYSNNAADQIKTIVKSFGTPASRFTDSDIDLTNFSAFASANPSAVGRFINARENVLNTCQELLNGFNSQLAMSRLGKLRIFKLEKKTTSTYTITESDLVQNSLSIADITEVSSSIKLGYAKNWTVQDNLQSSPIPEHLAMYGTEWTTITKTNNTVKTVYKRDEEPEQIDTALIDEADATAEADKRLAFYSEPHTVYKMVGYPQLFNLELGQAVSIEHKRYGLTASKVGMIISLSPNWVTLRIDLEVLI